MPTLEVLIAGYAAVVATAVAIMQIRSYFLDRPRLKIFASRSTHGPGAHGSHAIVDARMEELVEIQIANPGRDCPSPSARTSGGLTPHE